MRVFGFGSAGPPKTLVKALHSLMKPYRLGISATRAIFASGATAKVGAAGMAPTR